MKKPCKNEGEVPMKEPPAERKRPKLLSGGAFGMVICVLTSSFFMRSPILTILETLMGNDNDVLIEEVIVHPILSLQRNNNKSSKNAWDVFAFHRNKVMQLVQNAALMARTSTVSKQQEKDEQDHYHHQRSRRPQHAIFFGPGNCNDLNLPQLLDDNVFGTISLVDIDNATTKQGVDRQLAASTSADDNDDNRYRQRIVISPSIDLSNAISQTAGWAEDYNKSPPRHLYNTALTAVQTPIMTSTTDWLRSAAIGAPADVLDQGGYDVAVGLCILSQFASSFSLVLDSSDASRIMDLVVLVVAVRNRHMSQLIRSLRPGGIGVMIIDMVSMDTLPELRLTENHHDNSQEEEDVTTTAAYIEHLTEHAEQTGNLFHGTKRVAVVQALQGEFGHLVENVQLGPPWKWTLAANKQYIVYSVVFRRKQ